MVPHQWGEDSQRKEAKDKIPGRVFAETAKVSAGIEESAHIK